MIAQFAELGAQLAFLRHQSVSMWVS